MNLENIASELHTESSHTHTRPPFFDGVFVSNESCSWIAEILFFSKDLLYFKYRDYVTTAFPPKITSGFILISATEDMVRLIIRGCLTRINLFTHNSHSFRFKKASKMQNQFIKVNDKSILERIFSIKLQSCKQIFIWLFYFCTFILVI